MNKRLYNSLFLFVILLVILSALSGLKAEQPNQIKEATFEFDPDYRAEMVPITFVSKGSRLKGYFCSTSGEGPHPTIILLHGFPGNDTDVFGLAQTIPQAGWNALVFNYRGAFESEGLCTLQNSLEDVAEAVHFLRSESIAQKYSVNTEHIALAGYSYGGCMPIIAAAHDPSIEYLVSIAAGNMVEVLRHIEQSTELGKMLKSSVAKNYKEGPIKGPDFEKMMAETVAEKEKYDITRYAHSLTDRKILIIGAWQDAQATIEDHVLPFARELQRSKAKHMRPVLLDANHVFKSKRTELRRIITTWLKNQRID